MRGSQDNNSGDLIGFSDPRGCGANFFYDGLGRLKMTDLFPCASTQPAYSLPIVPGATLTGGVLTNNPGPPTSGVETAYEYDGLGAAAVPSGWSAGFPQGRLVRVRDQAAHALVQYDARGRIVDTAEQIAKPGPSADDTLANRFTPRWYRQTEAYDAADRSKLRSTGAATAVGGESGGTDATVLNLLGAGDASAVTTTYGPRGAVSAVTSSYDYGTSGGGNVLANQIARDADGLVTSVHYGDATGTTTTSTYQERRWLETVVTARAPLSSWPSSELDTYQMELENAAFGYDLVGNPLSIVDARDPDSWPSGVKPVSRTMVYDDFYRVKNIDYVYSGVTSNDPWTSPYANENAAFSSNASDPQGGIDSRRALPSPHVAFTNRMTSQAFAYDWMGNTTSTTDDASGFYDRSLGSGITNGTVSAGPYQLQAASITTGTTQGKLKAFYDDAGNMTELRVDRDGTCLPSSGVAGCSQIFKYEWDELNRLQRGRRWDFADISNLDSPPSTPDSSADADLRFRYDADDNRVIKWAHDADSSHAVQDAYTLYVFDSLEVRRAPFASSEYTLNSDTEVPYLIANGVRLARVVYDAGIPASDPQSQHVFFELGDHLGSTSTVLDKRTGELVEKGAWQAYGGKASDYRPGRWGDFREDYGFTGKEEDVEVGLVYFGKRYLNPLLGRWVSPDPLGIHDVGKADLNLYAYVSGMALKNVDPLGLDSIPGGAAPPEDASKGMGAPQEYQKTTVQADVEVKAAPPLESVPHWQGVLQATPERNPETRGHFLRRQALTDVASASLESAAVAADLATGNMTPMPFAEIAMARRADRVSEIGEAMLGGRRLQLQQTAIVAYDGEFAARQLLGTTPVTPGGRTIMAHAAERMVMPTSGRAPMSMGEVDQVLDTADRVRKMTVHPEGNTLTIQSTTMAGKPQVVVDAATGTKVISVIKKAGK